MWLCVQESKSNNGVGWHGTADNLITIYFSPSRPTSYDDGTHRWKITDTMHRIRLAWMRARLEGRE